MTIKISSVKWKETVEIIRVKNGIIIQVMTKAGRLYRSTSFRLTKTEAKKLAAELQQKAKER